jgi:glucosamine-6-phosphate deaminase
MTGDDRMTNPVREMKVGQLAVSVYPDNQTLGKAAATQAAGILRAAIAARGHANAILATGNSQLTTLAVLREANVDWSRVTLFHMDEYVGLPSTHPASFRKFLHEKIVDAVHPAAFYGVEGDAQDVEAACRRYAELLHQHPADLVCLGIGENGHIAFNDPPYADFDDPKWVKVVTLAEKSRLQQVGEGHFPTLEAVPTQAITLTIPALLAARHMLCIVPELRKAEPVKATLTGPIVETCPASILRTVAHARLLLDRDAASLL